MQFLAPAMLFGAAAVSIPIALHFFYRARYKPLAWAPMQFLKEAIEQTSRRLKFQEWILLALRCLAILLLVLAISRPGLRTATLAGRGEAIDAVFVFDTSLSMGASEGNELTRLDRAKKASLDVLDDLPSNSSIQIFGCADRAYFLGPVARFNLDQARQVISSIELTSLSTDLLPGLNAALDAVKAGNAPAREIYVFSDMQKSGFERQHGAIKAKCEEIKQIANLIFIRCANPDRKVGNIAVKDIALKTDIPHTRSRVPFVINLENTGSETVKNIRVSLELDGKSVEKEAVIVDQIEPGQAYPVTLTGSLDEPGPRMVTVQITGDELPGDNVLYRMIYVRDKVRVLIVDGAPNPDNPLESGDHFVKIALNPGLAPDYFIETDSIPANEVGPQHLDNKDIVVLLNAPIRDTDPLVGMSHDFLSKLNDFVCGGGGLLIAAGEKLNVNQYNKVLGPDGSKLLPYTIRGIRQTTEESPFVPAPESVAEGSFLSKFKDTYKDVFRFVTIDKMLDLNDGAADGRVVARTTDERPLIVSKLVGEGEVILIATSLDEQWGKFPSDGRVFVPFTRFVLLELTNRRISGGTSSAGEPLVWVTSEPTTEFDLVKPPKAHETYRPHAKIDVKDPGPGQKRTVTTTDTLRAGFYNIVPAGRADDAGPIFAVNPNLEETANLAAASDRDVEGWLGYAAPVIQAGAGTAAAVSQVRTRSEWTMYFLVAALLMLMAEAFWAWQCGRAW
jgi:hypothetical protein